MSTEPAKAQPVRRPWINVSGLFATLAVAVLLVTVTFGIFVGIDFVRPEKMADPLMILGTAATATCWVGLLLVGVRDAITTRLDRADASWATVEREIADIRTGLAALARRMDAGLLVIHDEVNGFAEEHTGEIRALAEAVRAYGEERETEGELAGIRRAAGESDKPPNGRVPHLDRLRPVR